MKAERWRQITQLYHAALARDGPERAAFLRDECAGDTALQREVESLLAQESGTESFLKLDLIGEQLGVYKVMSLLGSGGMGDVLLS
jgi:eukaryotic-like serine/threonine-protein kinase